MASLLSELRDKDKKRPTPASNKEGADDGHTQEA